MTFATKINSSILLIFLVVLFSSCAEDQALKKVNYHLSDTISQWLVSDSVFMRFEMTDNNGINREYFMHANEHDETLGSSYFMGIKTQVSFTEYYFQRFRSNYSDEFSISLYPSYNDDVYGEQIHFSLNDLSFHYDNHLNIITNIYMGSHYLNLRITSEGVEDDSLISSSLCFPGSFSINGKEYSKLFHFKLNDLKEYWDDYTITDIYYAQGVGLLRYDMNNGLIFTRK
ncbi:MAG TPA: hypothetical protein PLS94_01795 [Prolixibacteraceae bacterium]|nr:hypothetical protein [Prolixibacteraceae bacterium]